MHFEMVLSSVRENKYKNIYSWEGPDRGPPIVWRAKGRIDPPGVWGAIKSPLLNNLIRDLAENVHAFGFIPAYERLI